MLCALIAFSALALLVGCQKEHPVCKYWVMTYWCGYLFGARCRLFACGPADASAIPIPRYFLPDLNPDLFTSLVLAYQGCPGKRPLNERIRVVMLYSSPLLRNGTASVCPSVRPSVRPSVCPVDRYSHAASISDVQLVSCSPETGNGCRQSGTASGQRHSCDPSYEDRHRPVYLFIHLFKQQEQFGAM